MKRGKGILYFILFLSLVVRSEVLAAQDLLFDGSCDFGTICEKDGPVTRNFPFRNMRRDTVLICDITTPCRCITGLPGFTKVPPGQTGEIRLTFDPAYRSGPFSYKVALLYKGGELRQAVTVMGSVNPMSHPVEEDHPYSLGSGLYTSHRALPFGSLLPGQKKTIFFRYANGTAMPMKLEFEVEGDHAGAVVMDKTLDLAPDQRGKLYVTLTMPDGLSGNHEIELWPVVNGRRLDEPVTIRMSAKRINQ